MDTKTSLAANALLYSGSILVDPCPPVLPLPALLLLAALSQQHACRHPAPAWRQTKRAPRYRCAETGEYVTRGSAEPNPATTIKES